MNMNVKTNQTIKVLFTVVVMFLMALTGSVMALADGSSFVVTPVYNDKQKDGENGYFDMLVEPNTEVPLTLKLFNTSDSKAKIKITANDAVTNSNGIVDYTKGPADEFYAAHMTNIFTKMLDKTEEIVELEPNEEKDVTFTFKTSSEPFKGEVLGGFYLVDEDDEGTVSQAEGNMAIRNKFAYNIAVLATEGDLEGIEPQFSYIDTTIGQINYRNVVFANVLNDEPLIESTQKIESFIYNQGVTEGEPLFKQELLEPKFAPESAFPFPVYLNDIHFEPGFYTIKTVLTDSNNKEWVFVDDFEITKEEAKTYNDEVVSFTAPEKGMPTWLIVLIVLLVIIIIALIIYVIVSKKKQEQSRPRKQVKRKK